MSEKTDKKNTAKAVDIIFVIIFILILIIPFVFMDHTPVIDSVIENRRMTMWPGFGFDSLHNDWFGHYAEDRVFLREEAIRLKADANALLFDDFSEDLHMWGKEGYIYPADKDYIGNYQRLNVNEDLIYDLTTYAANTEGYAKENGMAFVLMIAPNKSSVYPEFMPDDIHLDESRASLLSCIGESADKKGVTCVIPDDVLTENKESLLIGGDIFGTYNKRYDCAHWNDFGAFCALKKVDEVIAGKVNVPAVTDKDFDKSVCKKDDLEFFTSDFKISDVIPVFTCNKPAGEAAQLSFEPTVLPGNNMAYIHNEEALSDKSILILHDSFLDGKESWYSYRYKDVYITSRVNYENMKEYMDNIHPDVILFEVAERSFVDDLPAYTSLGSISYH